MNDLFLNVDTSASDPDQIVVWFSCGAASTVTAQKTIEKYGHDRVRLVNIFWARALQSRRLGVRLVRFKGQRIFLDELPEDAVRRPLKDMDFECGIFCQPEKINA